MTWLGIRLSAGATLIGLALAGCSADDTEDPGDAGGEQVETDNDAADVDGEAADEPYPREGDRRVVNAECVEPWPLTVEEGEAWCDGDWPYVDAVGTTWGLTGAAYTLGEGEELDDSIWAGNPDIEGTKINISELRDAALELC